MIRAEVRGRLLLVLGMAAGIALAGWGLVRSGSAPQADPDGAVALVNGQPLSRESFARFTAAVAAEREQLELDPETRRHLLDRMIDEELLFQRGLALGLPRHEPTARRAVVAALIASVSADAESAEPDEENLRRYYEENRERFARPGRVRVEMGFLSTAERPAPEALRAARELAERVRAGGPLVGDATVAPLPDGPLAFETLRQYLGPTVARAALGLETGAVSEPVRGGDGYYVLRVRERTPEVVPPFEAVRVEVRNEVLRSRGDDALRDYVAGLRADGDVRVLDPELR